MLPFALKVAWFILSVSGMFSSQAKCVASNTYTFPGTVVSVPVLIAFSKAINAQWIPLSYFLANIVLQGSFCIGESTSYGFVPLV